MLIDDMKAVREKIDTELNAELKHEVDTHGLGAVLLGLRNYRWQFPRLIKLSQAQRRIKEAEALLRAAVNSTPDVPPYDPYTKYKTF